jgi:hypothetical protein
MSRRAQIIGQVFIFIIAGLVFVLILGYGYKAITHLLERGEQVQLLDFRNELESVMNTIKRDYGSVQRVDLRVPAKTETVCLVSSDQEDIADVELQQLQQEYPLLAGAWATGTENVFLIPRQPTPIRVNDMKVEGGYSCVAAINGRVSLRVEGAGNKAAVSPWQVS